MGGDDRRTPRRRHSAAPWSVTGCMNTITVADIQAIARLRDEISPTPKAATSAGRQFQNDMSAALRGVQTSADDLDKHVADMQARMNRFDGGKIKADADEYSAAVRNAGGAARLTTSEQEELNGVLDEAI